MSPWSLAEYPPMRDHFLSRLQKKLCIEESLNTIFRSGGFCCWNVDNWGCEVPEMLDAGAGEEDPHGWHGVAPLGSYPQLSSDSHVTEGWEQFLQQLQLPSSPITPNCRHCLQVVGQTQFLCTFLHSIHWDLPIVNLHAELAIVLYLCNRHSVLLYDSSNCNCGSHPGYVSATVLKLLKALVHTNINLVTLSDWIKRPATVLRRFYFKNIQYLCKMV